ncbi:1,4-dihydroxy-2-naphthoate synthase [Janibacter hoylei PVAS-1]|uniref:1,4-dihydroxy-2-naphthoate synthase n=1 Tax=Janibacter hoylei PVAS-1 TaxID=1210046 RepID=K1E972_9MICO|nr:1,4-dihydroxy-2-naphthoate synthase [Janibacter hoylei PVAS-1]
MSALDNVSETFDPQAWEVVPGFEDLTDLTYHRAKDVGCVRIAFDRPEILNAFRPHTVDELYRTLDHARRTPRCRRRPADRQRPDPTRGQQCDDRGLGLLHRRRPAHPRPLRLPVRRRPRWRRLRGRHQRASGQGRRGAPPHPRGPAPHPHHAQGRHRAGRRVGRRRRALAARRLRHDPRQPARALQADRRRRRLLRRRLRQRLPREDGGAEARSRDLLPRPRLHGPGDVRDGRGQCGRRPRGARGRGAADGPRDHGEVAHRDPDAQVRLQPHRRRAHGPAGLRRRGDPPGLHDRRGGRGARPVPREA